MADERRQPAEQQRDTATLRMCPVCDCAVPDYSAFCTNGHSVKVDFKPGAALVGSYEFVKVIGTGGTSTVYEARHSVLGKRVAIKVLHPHAVTEEVIMRFQKEGSTSSNLDHRNLVSVHDMGTTESGQIYMVMDYVEGRSLEQILQEDGPLAPDLAIEMFLQLCDVLGYAHDKGVLHRDVKPGNILCTGKSLTPKLVDFGIARVLERDRDDEGRITADGEFVGSPAYASPEQCEGKNSDGRSDIYSLGCVLYKALTGKVPFPTATAMSSLLRHQDDKPQSLNKMRTDVKYPQLLDEIIVKALARNPDARYQSMSELSADLANVQTEYRSTRMGSPLKLPHKLIFVGFYTGLLVIISAIFAVLYMMSHKAPPLEAPIAPPHVVKASREQQVERAKRLLSLIAVWKITDDDLANLFPIDTGQEKLDLGGAWSVTDAGLRTVKVLKSLEELDIGGTQISAQGLGYLDSFAKLRSLNLRRLNISEHNLQQILNPLRELVLSETPINDGAIAKIVRMQQKLKSLRINGTLVTDKGVQSLSELNLSELDLSATRISDESMKTVSAMKELKTLSINDTSISDASATEFRKLTNLKTLFAECTGIGDATVIELGKLKNLEALNLNSSSAVTERGIAGLSGCTNLELLSLNGLKISDGAASAIASLPKLEELYLQGTRLTDRGIASLSHSTSIEKLDLCDVSITDEGLKSLAGLKSLESLKLCRTHVTDKGLSYIKDLPNLAELDLQDCEQVSIAGVRTWLGGRRYCKVGMVGTELTAPPPPPPKESGQSAPKKESGSL